MNGDEEESDIVEDLFELDVIHDDGSGKLVFGGAMPQCVIKWPSDPKCDGKGWFPLQTNTATTNRNSLIFIEAIGNKEWDTVSKCLQTSLNLNMVNDRGETALHMAISTRNRTLVRFLLHQDIDVTTCTDEGATPLHFACAHNDLRLVSSLLHRYWLNGEHDKTIHKLTTNGDNALHFAAHWGNVRIAKRLVRAGVDYTCKNKEGNTPLDYANQFDYPAFAQYITDVIAQEQTKIKAQMAALTLTDQAYQLQLRQRNENLRQQYLAPIKADAQMSWHTPPFDSWYSHTGIVGPSTPITTRRTKVRFVQDDDENDVIFEKEEDNNTFFANEQAFWDSKTKKKRTDIRGDGGAQEFGTIDYWNDYDDDFEGEQHDDAEDGPLDRESDGEGVVANFECRYNWDDYQEYDEATNNNDAVAVAPNNNALVVPNNNNNNDLDDDYYHLFSKEA